MYSCSVICVTFTRVLIRTRVYDLFANGGIFYASLQLRQLHDYSIPVAYAFTMITLKYSYVRRGIGEQNVANSGRKKCIAR